ncbi:uncharacterized protein METZ01_LOCUS286952, partial [marine metagenome]
DDYVTQNGGAAGNVSSIVSFSGDSASVIMTFQDEFDLNDSLVIQGLSIIPYAPSEQVDHLMISFNEGSSFNLVDEKDFYIGEISFKSVKENIVVKGGNNVGSFSSIRIEEKSIIPRLQSLVLNIPPELSVGWSEENLFSIESFDGTPGLVLAKLDLDNVAISPVTDQKLVIPFIGQNKMDPGDIIYINNLLYANQSVVSDPSIITYLGLEVADGIFIPDSLPSFLASSFFESEAGNSIINRGNLENFRLNNLLIGNDTLLYNRFGVEIIEPDDILSIKLPSEFSIHWSESVLSDFTIEDMQGDNWINNGILVALSESREEIIMTIESALQGNILSINNLHVDISDSLGVGYVNLEKNNTGELIGIDKYAIAVGIPTINYVQDNNLIWLDAQRSKILPTIEINE